MNAVKLGSLVTAWALVFLGCVNENSDWRNATSANTEEGYLGFLEQHPDGEYASDAQRALEGLRWENATTVATEDAYSVFLEQHPDGDYASDAQQALEDTRWNDATNVDTEEGYLGFLEQHPDGEYASNAHGALAYLRDYRPLDTTLLTCLLRDFHHQYSKGEIGGHIGGLLCRIAGRNTDLVQISLASNELTNGEIVTQRFGVFRVSAEGFRIEVLLTGKQTNELLAFLRSKGQPDEVEVDKIRTQPTQLTPAELDALDWFFASTAIAIAGRVSHELQISEDVQETLSAFDDVEDHVSAEDVDVRLMDNGLIIVIPDGAHLVGTLGSPVDMSIDVIAGELGVVDGEIFVSDEVVAVINNCRYRRVREGWSQSD